MGDQSLNENSLKRHVCVCVTTANILSILIKRMVRIFSAEIVSTSRALRVRDGTFRVLFRTFSSIEHYT